MLQIGLFWMRILIQIFIDHPINIIHHKAWQNMRYIAIFVMGMALLAYATVYSDIRCY